MLTREEAIKLNSKGATPRLIDKELINKIYNDLESRTCASCKLEYDKICPVGTLNPYLISDDFGCNGWIKIDG